MINAQMINVSSQTHRTVFSIQLEIPKFPQKLQIIRLNFGPSPRHHLKKKNPYMYSLLACQLEDWMLTDCNMHVKKMTTHWCYSNENPGVYLGRTHRRVVNLWLQQRKRLIIISILILIPMINNQISKILIAEALTS